MFLPPALANVLNTLRADVDFTEEKLRRLMRESAERRTFEDRDLHEVLDDLKNKVAARLMDWSQKGVLSVGEPVAARPPEEAPAPSGIAFPQPNLNPS